MKPLRVKKSLLDFGWLRPKESAPEPPTVAGDLSMQIAQDAREAVNAWAKEADAYDKFIKEGIKRIEAAGGIATLPSSRVWYSLDDWIEPGPRADGLAPEDAWIDCTTCGETWHFQPVPYGGYEVSACGHYFLEHMSDIVSAFAGFTKPKDGIANYRIVFEPPA